MALLNPFLGYTAGALTILSPCVLPLVPIVLGSAAQKHRFGPFALAFGLVASFTAIGMAVAVLGPALGFNGEGLRLVGALVLVAAGLALVVPHIQALLTSLTTPLANWANARQVGLDRFGLLGQAAIGGLLGVVWSPCVGPTLGAATALAAQGQDIGQVALVMLAFALGSGVAGVAGVALSQIDNVSPNLGQGYIIDSFMVVVFGGVGNLWGTALGAIILGLANKVMEPTIGAVQGQIVLLVLIILFIQKRPRGLFAQKGRAVEA